jgi:cyclophilin family peptidyl-prolyl cis-trans isomerase
MVVKKRSSASFDSEEYILPYGNDAGDLEDNKIRTRAIHDCLTDGEPSPLWRKFRSKKSEPPVLPTFTTRCNPQSADFSSPTSVKSTIVFTTRKRKMNAFTFLVFGLVIVGLAVYGSSKTSFRSISDEISVIEGNLKTLLFKVRGSEKDVRVLEREVSALELMSRRRLEQKEEVGDHSLTRRRLSEMKAKVEGENARADSLRERVRTLSRHEALQKYGPGPHRVEIELIFAPDERPNSFIVELAPLDTMPHSVDTFLEMVSSGLWDGCSFVMNAVHVVKASPLPVDEHAVDKLDAFEKKGLHHLAFSEFSEDYNHEPYTLGFAGGDSPSWYINTEDNTDFHRGEPCFGKVVSGFDTIDKLKTRPTKDGIWYKHRVEIKHAKIL